MKAASALFKVEMVKRTLNPLYRFKYNAIHYTDYVETYSAITQASDKVSAGNVILGLVNTEQTWNIFLTTLSNFRKTATIEYGVGGIGTIARAGVARAGTTVAGYVYLLPGSVWQTVSSIPRFGEWIALFTALGDESFFHGTLVDLTLRDRMMQMLEKPIGSVESPADYYTASYTPSDLVWDILDNYGGLDNTASTANADIDYTSWNEWNGDCDALSLSLEAKLEGMTVGRLLEKVAYLSSTIIYVGGDGKLYFYRYLPFNEPLAAFDEDKIDDLRVRQTFTDGLVNEVTCYYDYDAGGASPTWNGSGTNNDVNSQNNFGKVALTEEDTSVWHATIASATDFIARILERHTNPRERVIFNLGLEGFVYEPGDLVDLSDDFLGYVTTPFEIDKLSFDLNRGIATIEALNVEFYAIGGFLLDDAYWGLLDKGYNPLY